MTVSEMTVADVVRMALTMEEKGENLYSWAAGKFNNDEVADMFKRLAAEEKEHAMIFRRLLDASGVPEEGISSDLKRYFKLLAGSEGLFPSYADLNEANVKAPVDVLAIGIQAEKDSILFYQEMYQYSKSQEVKDALSKLLEEEKMHLLELRDSMEELTAVQE